eukprot:1184021-Prorocentrum_minimum.AAC.4
MEQALPVGRGGLRVGVPRAGRLQVTKPDHSNLFLHPFPIAWNRLFRDPPPRPCSKRVALQEGLVTSVTLAASESRRGSILKEGVHTQGRGLYSRRGSVLKGRGPYSRRGSILKKGVHTQGWGLYLRRGSILNEGVHT